MNVLLPEAAFQCSSTVACAVLATTLALVYIMVQPRRSAPGPRRFPLLGNAPQVLWQYHRFLDWFVDLRETYGPTVSIKIPSQPEYVMVSTPECVEHILKTNFSNYQKGPEWRERFHELLGEGIFNADGPSWLSQRKIASNLFSVNNFKDHMLEVFNRHAAEVVRQVANTSTTRGDLDMHALYHAYTLDSMGEVGFGVNIGSLHGEVPFQKSFDYCQTQAAERFFRTNWKLQKWLNPAEWKMRSHLSVVHEFADAVVAARQSDLAAGRISERRDLLSLFMSRSDGDGKPFSGAYLRDVILNFTIAGRDTTAQALSWTTWLLANHPEVERTMCAEIDEFVTEETVSFETARQLTYTTAVFNEALRLYPSVPKDAVWAAADDVLPDGTAIRAGTQVVWLPYVMARDPAIWPNPTAFDPTRFIEEGKAKMFSPFVNSAFKAGPRTCLGLNMAKLEATIMLALLYRTHVMRPVPGCEPKIKNSASLPMENGIRLAPIPRERHLARG